MVSNDRSTTGVSNETVARMIYRQKMLYLKLFSNVADGGQTGYSAAYPMRASIGLKGMCPS